MGLDRDRIRAICFDVDGTLADTDRVWQERFVRMLAPLRFLFRNRDTGPFARRVVMGIESPSNLVYHWLDRLDLDDDAGRIYMALKRLNKRVKSSLPPVWGVEEMIRKVALRYPLAIVSARDMETTQRFLSSSGLAQFFPVVASSQTCRYTKPFPDPVIWAAERLGVAPQTCLMVGDTLVDIRAGRAAGAQTAGVLCGFGEERELRRGGADMILNSTAELAEALL